MKMTELLPSLERAVSHLRAVAIASFLYLFKKNDGFVFCSFQLSVSTSIYSRTSVARTPLGP